jgi:hypothetical protein
MHRILCMFRYLLIIDFLRRTIFINIIYLKCMLIIYKLFIHFVFIWFYLLILRFSKKKIYNVLDFRCKHFTNTTHCKIKLVLKERVSTKFIFLNHVLIRTPLWVYNIYYWYHIKPLFDGVCRIVTANVGYV